MEHLITVVNLKNKGLDKNEWFFHLPNESKKSFAQLEDEGWELTATFGKYFFWKRKKLG